MSIFLVTGTSTDVGKTVVTAALASVALQSGKSVAVLKPAQTGVDVDGAGDLAEIERLTGGGVTLVELARYPEPLAPDTAARRSGLPLLELDDVVRVARDLDTTHDLTLIEGAGGLLVRLGVDGFTARDLAAALAAPVVLVVASGLGTLNHTALTVEALGASGVECAGLVIGSWPQEPDLAERCNREDLVSVSGVPLLGLMPAGSGSESVQEFAQTAWGALGKSPLAN
ncbi:MULTISPECIES: dethiobiotin synthase [Rhodococcus]|jgi:dethiobiotin synthetase|uniref:dethiobiotin synthase n=1 Tax=Rhodococcus TaxID=1827 RepID=UPI00038E5B26|nr:MULTISPECIES: dethiobiotin synthase [Rhodococcus]EQM31628.1 dithiobiotin synthetase [Rhodococcus erythropolis DN1]MDN3455999.1 dethiobiotin synthase [Rhodococcus sp. APC 3903]MQP34158.1 ATP-dependent dethiobiotin synthetase BioD [Rhodococcus erythropolis]